MAVDPDWITGRIGNSPFAGFAVLRLSSVLVTVADAAIAQIPGKLVK